MPLINISRRILTDNSKGSAAQRKPDAAAEAEAEVVGGGAGEADADRARDEGDPPLPLRDRRDLGLDEVSRRDRRRPLAEDDDLLAADPDDERKRRVAHAVVRQHELEPFGRGDAGDAARRVVPRARYLEGG